MPTKTLTATKTSTITTTRMLTATLALMFANAAALAVVPLEQRPLFTARVQCPVSSLSFENSCGKGKFRQVTVICDKTGVELRLQKQAKTCLSASEWDKQAALACQSTCVAQKPQP